MAIEQMELLDRILRDRVVVDEDGHAHDLHSETSKEQCEFIVDLVNRSGATRCLEVGLAYGISALAICGAIKSHKNSVFYSIDPQQGYWKNIGIHNLKTEGYWDFVRFFAENSDVALSRLWLEGVTLDFAYIDSTKVFDVLAVDAHLIHKMLKVGGILVLDDLQFPGVRKLARMLVQFPHWEICGIHGLSPPSLKMSCAAKLARVMPYRERVLTSELCNPDLERRINAQAIALRKVSDDGREWNWTCSF